MHSSEKEKIVATSAYKNILIKLELKTNDNLISVAYNNDKQMIKIVLTILLTIL